MIPPMEVTPWNFSDLDSPEMKKHVRDPLTTIIMAAIFPFFEQGSKVGLSGDLISIHKPSQFYCLDLYYFKVTTECVQRYYEDNNNLKVFHFNTFKACELYDPSTPGEVNKLFQYAYDGIPAAKEAYKPKPDEGIKGKSSPCDAIDTYRTTIALAMKGHFKFNTQLSEAEHKVKNIWRESEIKLINDNIALMKENKELEIDYETNLNNILSTLVSKQKLFNQICEEVLAKKLKLEKPNRPALPPQVIPQVIPPPPPKEKEEDVPDEAVNLVSIVPVQETPPPPKPAPVKPQNQTKKGK